MDKWPEKDLSRTIIESLIIIHILVFITILTTNCRQPSEVKIIKDPPPVEIIISETVKKEDVKTMAPECHLYKVPRETLIGEMVTVREEKQDD